MKTFFNVLSFSGGLLLLNGCVDTSGTPYGYPPATGYPRQGYYNEQQRYYGAPQYGTPQYVIPHDNGNHYGQKKHHKHDYDDDDHDDNDHNYGQNNNYRVNPSAPSGHYPGYNRTPPNDNHGYGGSGSRGAEEYQSQPSSKHKKHDD